MTGDATAAVQERGALQAVPASDHVLVMEDVAFAYADGVPVIDGLSFSLKPGSVLGLVGPSGCGKSTILSLVAGLRAQKRGSVRTSFTDPQRHYLSMLFQRETLLPWLTVTDNVKLHFRFAKNRRSTGRVRQMLPGGGRRNSTVDDYVHELLAMMHLADRANLYPYQLSGGMRRRLAFCVAIAPKPELLLLDEPFSSVDEPTRVGIHQDVFAITRAMGTSAVLVTHDLAEAAAMCDSVIVLSNRPARVATQHEVPFGDSRNMLELRAREDFLELYGLLWSDLSDQIGRGQRG